MAELVSIHKFDSPPQDGAARQWAVRAMFAPTGEKGEGKESVIWSASPLSASYDVGSPESLGGHTPSREDFSSRRPPVTVQWRNVELTTKTGEFYLSI